MIKNEEMTWSKLCVFVCTKCHNLFASEELQEAGNCGENLKNFLKSQIKEAGQSSQVRVMTSSCQGVCLNDRQSIVIASSQEKKSEVLTCHPEKDRMELLKKIYQSF